MIRRDAGWVLHFGGRTEATFATRDEAVENAASLARERGAGLLVQARTGRRMIALSIDEADETMLELWKLAYVGRDADRDR